MISLDKVEIKDEVLNNFSQKSGIFVAIEIDWS
jgi:hypothetical protein